MLAPKPSQRRMMAERGLLYSTDVAQIVGTHVTSLYRLVERNNIKHEKLGSRWYINVDSLATYYVDKGGETIPRMLRQKLAQVRLSG